MTHRVLEVEGFRTQDYPGGISPEGFISFTARENYTEDYLLFLSGGGNHCCYWRLWVAKQGTHRVSGELGTAIGTS